MSASRWSLEDYCRGSPGRRDCCSAASPQPAAVGLLSAPESSEKGVARSC